MMIHLPKDVESSIRQAVESGQFASFDEAMTEAARLLLKESKQTKSAKTRVDDAEDSVLRQMLADGLITQLPNRDADFDDDEDEDEPVVIDGEPLSETIIRERR